MRLFHIALIATSIAISFQSRVYAAIGYNFTRVAQTQPGVITDFDTFALNGAGQVAYSGYLPNGGKSIFRWTAGQTVQLATEGDLYQGQAIAVPGRLDMNDLGTVAFETRRFTGHNVGIVGVFRTDGTELIKLAPLQPQSSYFVEWLNLNDDGSVIYTVSTSGSVILAKSDGQSIQSIYSDSTWDPEFPRVNKDGDVVFLAFSGQSPLPYREYLVHNGAPTILADTSPLANPRFANLSGININNLGRIIFSGAYFESPIPPPSPNSLFSLENGQLTRLIDPSQNAFFEIDGLPGINDSGQIAFWARLDSLQTGIFVGLNPDTDALVKTTQTFDSKTVSSVSIYGDINNAGQVVFEATFTDGSRGIYLATPIPEPGTVSLALVAMIVQLQLTYRNSRGVRRARGI